MSSNNERTAPNNDGAATGNDEIANLRAAISGSSAVAYVPTLTAQMKEDVIYSTLLAQIAADKKFSGRPIDKVEEWQEHYWTVLDDLGWITEDNRLTEIGYANEFSSVDGLVMQIEGPHLQGAERLLFAEMLSALREPENSDALEVFDKAAAHGQEAGFQVGVVTNWMGKAMFKLGTHQYRSSDAVTSPLYFDIESAKIERYFAGHRTMILDESVYANVRYAVRDKVNAENGEDLIKAIETS
ncbi:hypothetical protein GY45DRAFT_1435530 [Cubamyces sp. BRFM 1775]|nr:hypothetical protein GY45DRAFT_1435530 [Cubamyces sp. BRFM 1775]